ncbi:hypothetical protein MTO96_012365 [Rhipicephalus appendiculatus]
MADIQDLKKKVQVRNHSIEDQPYSERRNYGAYGQMFNTDKTHGGDATIDIEMEREEGTPLASTGTCGGKQTEENERGKVPEAMLCPYCQKSWELQEIDDHEKACAECVTECDECLQAVKHKDYEDHLMECQRKVSEKKPDEPPMNSRNADGDNERRQKMEEIEALKGAISALEERIEKFGEAIEEGY